MLHFELPAAIALGGVVLLSALLLPTTTPDTERPVLDENDWHTEDSESHTRDTLDPFAVTSPADVLEGFPLDEPAFWRKTRSRHLLIATFLAAAAAVDVAAFAAALVAGAPSAVHILRAFVPLYMLALSLIALSRSRGPVPGEDTLCTKDITHAPWLARIAMHEHVVLHACGVGIPASLLGAAVALVPGGLEGSAGPAVAHLLLVALATALVMAVPMGPAMYLPLTQIYDEKTAGLLDGDSENTPAPIDAPTASASASERTPLLPTTKPDKLTKSTTYENVAGVRTASLWSTLLFSYTTPVIFKGYSTLADETASFDIRDLPILPADMRATFNYSRMRAALRGNKRAAKGGKMEEQEGWASKIKVRFGRFAAACNSTSQAALDVDASVVHSTRWSCIRRVGPAFDASVVHPIRQSCIRRVGRARQRGRARARGRPRRGQRGIVLCAGVDDEVSGSGFGVGFWDEDFGRGGGFWRGRVFMCGSL